MGEDDEYDEDEYYDDSGEPSDPEPRITKLHNRIISTAESLNVRLIWL